MLRCTDTRNPHRPEKPLVFVKRRDPSFVFFVATFLRVLDLKDGAPGPLDGAGPGPGLGRDEEVT